MLPGLHDRRDHGVEAGGSRRDVDEVQRPHGRGDVARPGVHGDHGAPDEAVAAGQFVEQAAGDVRGGRPAGAVGGDERGGDEGAAEEAAALDGERVDRGGGGRDAERGGGLEGERESVREGRVGERRERRVGGHPREEGQRVAVAACVHVAGQLLRQRRQPPMAGDHCLGFRVEEQPKA